MTTEIKITEDGSHTLFVPSLNEHYHSTFGALQESLHIFINAGFNELKHLSNPIHILEIGFGTGLNAILTLIEAEKNKQIVHYTSLEAFPISNDIYSKLNFTEQLKLSRSQEIFIHLHDASWNEEIKINDTFFLNKIHKSLLDFKPENNKFHLIYFDAFGPMVQPELWTTEIFRMLWNSLLPDGILITYSTKGDVKRALKSAGFTIEKLPGPKGKREITRGWKR